MTTKRTTSRQLRSRTTRTAEPRSMTTFVVSKERNAAYPTMDAAYLDGAPFATLIEVETDVDPAPGYAWFCDGGNGDQMFVKSFSAAGRWMMYEQPAGERSITAVAIRQ